MTGKTGRRYIELGMAITLPFSLVACDSHDVQANAPTQTRSVSPSSEGVDDSQLQSKLVVGCKIFRVYAQNRFEPYGVAVRTVPSILAPMSTDYKFAPNQVIPIDGWEHTGTVTYPDQLSPQLRSDVWYHVAPLGTSLPGDENPNAAWVSFAGVRGEPTVNDPSALSQDIGTLAQMQPECEIKPAIDVPR